VDATCCPQPVGELRLSPQLHRPPGAYELEPNLPLQTGQFQTPVDRSLLGAFSDTAPDRWGRRLIERTEAASAREERRTARSFSEADYLLGVRDDMRQGALRYRHPDGDAFLAPEDTGVPALLQLGTLLNAAEALERDDPTS
jgi:serine/threonine-protein kinase HipA